MVNKEIQMIPVAGLLSQEISYISGEIITTSLFSLTGILVNKENHPQMALIQVRELL